MDVAILVGDGASGFLSLSVCVTAAAVVDHIKREKKEKRGICAFFLTQLKMKKKKKKKN